MSARWRLLRWGSWFAIANAAVLAIVGLRYLWYYSTLGPSPAWVYAILAYVGQMSALAYLPFLLLLAPAIALLPRPRVILPLAVVLAGISLGVLLLDSLVFAENRYHLSPLRFAILAPQTWAFLTLYVLLGIAIEAMLAGWLWKRTAHPPVRRIGRYLAMGLAICFVSSHLIHAWADAHYYVPVTAFTRYLPLYFPLKDSRRMARLGLVNEARAREQRLVSSFGQPRGGDLNYPLAPLRCQPPSPPLNVLLVVIDGMRADTLTPAVAPRLAGFAPETIRFDAHYSGGNASRAGMFSIFYSLPATYWDAFADVARPPVLMDLFREYGYRLGVFSSSPVNSWVVELDRTALARIPNLPYLDRRVVRVARPSRRLASLLRLPLLQCRGGFRAPGALRARGAGSTGRDGVGAPPRPLPQCRALHRFPHRSCARRSEAPRAPRAYRGHRHLRSRHGVRRSRAGLHGPRYRLQRAPAALAASRALARPPAGPRHPPSHNDLAPTLLTGVFGCTNPPSDYASGQSLFGDWQWDWLIAASHNDFALIEPDRVTIAYPAGYEIRDRSYRLVQKPTIPHYALRAALQEMRRFYR